MFTNWMKFVQFAGSRAVHFSQDRSMVKRISCGEIPECGEPRSAGVR